MHWVFCRFACQEGCALFLQPQKWNSSNIMVQVSECTLEQARHKGAWQFCFALTWGEDLLMSFQSQCHCFISSPPNNNWKLLPLCHYSAVTFNNVAMPIKCVRVVGLHESFVTNGGTQWIHAWLWPVAQTKFSFFKVWLVNKGWAAVVFHPYRSGQRANRRLYANQEDCPPSFAKDTTFRGQMLYKFLQQVNILGVLCL